MSTHASPSPYHPADAIEPLAPASPSPSPSPPPSPSVPLYTAVSPRGTVKTSSYELVSSPSGLDDDDDDNLDEDLTSSSYAYSYMYTELPKPIPAVVSSSLSAAPPTATPIPSSSSYGTYADWDAGLADDLSLVEPTLAPSSASGALLSSSSSATTSWNTLYQHTLDLPASASKFTLLTKLSQDFIAHATRYGRTIIAERALPVELRTIQPASLSGIAGGDKFIVNGILFKFPRDRELAPNTFLYGGSESSPEYAQKAAGHDLRFASHYLSAIQSDASLSADVRVPMQALVDFMGYRAIAVALLPLEKLVYGSDDGGHSVHDSDPVARHAMEQLAERLHLRGHLAGHREAKHLFSAGDVEMHVGSDDRYYILDLARALPPESTRAAKHLHNSAARGRPEFFRLLRPELLALLKQRGLPPLNPDAFTLWGQRDPDFAAHMRDVHAATQFLFAEAVPSLARWLEARVTRENQAAFQTQVVEIAHSRGINARHLGLVRSHLEEINSAAGDILLVECVKRTLKNLLRDQLRHAAKSSQGFSSFTAIAHCARFASLVADAQPAADTFWANFVQPGVAERFGDVALLAASPLRTHPAVRAGLYHMITYTLAMVGFGLSPRCDESCRRRGLVGFGFSLADIVETEPRVKYLSVLEQARGRMLTMQADALLASGPAHELTASRLLHLAAAAHASALKSHPNDASALRESAISTNRAAALRKQFREADLALLGRAEQALDLGSFRLARDVAVPLLLQLFQQWRARCKDAALASSVLHTGGASSGSIAHRALRAGRTAYHRLESPELLEHLRMLGRRRLVAIKLLWEVLRQAEEPVTHLLALQPDTDGSRRAVDLVTDADDVYPLWIVRYHTEQAFRIQVIMQVEERSGLQERLTALFIEAVRAQQFILAAMLGELGVDLNERDPEMHQTYLMRAVQNVDIDLVRGLVQAGCRLEITDREDETALIKAIRLGPDGEAITNVLLDAGASAAVANGSGSALIHAVLARCSDQLVTRLASQASHMLEHVSADRSMTAVGLALDVCHPPAVAALIRVGAKIDTRDNLGRSLIRRAVDRCTPDSEEAVAATVQALLDTATPLPTQLHSELQAAFTLAVTRGLLLVAATLCRVDGAVDVNARDSAGFTPLMKCAQLGRPDSLVYLLVQHADAIDVQANDGQMTALALAAEAGHAQSCHALLSLGKADPNARPSDTVQTPLHFACEHGHHEVVAELLEFNADMSLLASTEGQYAMESEKMSALHVAATAGQAECARLLVQHGAQLNAANGDGKTPLMCSAEIGHTDVIKVLLDADGIDVNATDDMGFTALMYSVDVGPEAVRLIIDSGKADLLLVDSSGYSALVHATMASPFEPEVVRLLVEAGADLEQGAGDRAWPPLFWAARYQTADVVNHLLTLGANPLGRDAEGMHVTDVADLQPARRQDINKLLRAAIAERTGNRDEFVGEEFSQTAATKMKAVFADLAATVTEAAATATSTAQQLMPQGGKQKKKGKKKAMFRYEAPSKKKMNNGKVIGKVKASANVKRRIARQLQSRGDVDPYVRVLEMDRRFRRDHANRVTSDVLTDTGPKLSVLVQALRYGFDDVASQLIEKHGANVHVVESENLNSPIHAAAETGNLPVVKQLIAAGVRLDVQNRYFGRTPLMLAAFHLHVDVVRELLSAGCKWHFRDSIGGETALHYACKSRRDPRQVEVVRAIQEVARSPKFIDLQDTGGITPLGTAAIRGRTDVVKYLLSEGANPNIFSYDRQTVLVRLAQITYESLVIMGDARDPVESEVLEAKQVEVCRLIMQQKNLSRTTLMLSDLSGKTALHYAAANGRVELAKMLDTRIPSGSKDDDGNTPADLARAAGHLELAELLEVEEEETDVEEEDSAVEV